MEKNKIKEMVLKLIDRVEKEMPEEGPFPDIYEDYTPTDDNKDVSLYRVKIYKMVDVIDKDQSKRYIEVIAFDINQTYKIDMLIFGGGKNRILNALMNTETAVDAIEAAFLRLTEEIVD